MKSSQNLLFAGILCIIIGLVLLVFSSGTIEGTTFFIFPFFFFSTSNPLSIILVAAIGIVFVLIFLRSTKMFFGNFERIDDQYLKVGSKCPHCLEPLPKNASFCNNCGNPVDLDKYSND